MEKNGTMKKMIRICFRLNISIFTFEIDLQRLYEFSSHDKNLDLDNFCIGLSMSWIGRVMENQPFLYAVRVKTAAW